MAALPPVAFDVLDVNSSGEFSVTASPAALVPPTSPDEFASAFAEVREVGRGRFGAAILVRHVASGGEYILKRTQFGSKGQLTAAAVGTEADALARMHHENIVRYYSRFTEAGASPSMCILMEYASRGDFASLLARRWWDAVRAGEQQLPEGELMGWFVQLACGLAHAHAMRVLHRDLKVRAWHARACIPYMSARVHPALTHACLWHACVSAPRPEARELLRRRRRHAQDWRLWHGPLPRGLRRARQDGRRLARPRRSHTPAAPIPACMPCPVAPAEPLLGCC